jgi:hypothetical protein
MIKPEFSNLQLDIHSFSQDQREELNRRAMPGSLSVCGFIASDEDIFEISKADAKVLSEHKITYEQLGDRIDDVIERANQVWRVFGYGKTAIIDGCIEVLPYLSSLGHQQCLFGTSWTNTCGKGSSLITIRNKKLPDQKLSNVTELHGHLIRDHHFCQGNTSYRVDPELAIRILDLKPGVSYTPKINTYFEWISDTSGDDIPPNLERQVRDAAIDIMSIYDGKGCAILCCLDFDAFTDNLIPSDKKYLYVFVKEATRDPLPEADIFGARINNDIGSFRGYSRFIQFEYKEVELGPDDSLEI